MLSAAAGTEGDSEVQNDREPCSLSFFVETGDKEPFLVSMYYYLVD